MTITSSPPAPTVTKPERVPRFRRPQRWTLGHVLPVVLAIFTLIFVLVALRDRTTQTSVVVAAQQIPAGAAINTGDTRVVKMGASDARHLTGLITLAQLKGTLTAAAPIGPGEPILTGQTVTGPAGGTGLGAMSIPIPVDQADGGAIAVGDQVDIISGSTSGATYVAQHLSVLAVAAPKTTGVLSAAATSYSITVAVNQPTALRLTAALAAASGSTGNNLEVIRSTGETGPSPQTYTNPSATKAAAG
jgi:Flp pilus assembly protein CpaB